MKLKNAQTSGGATATPEPLVCIQIARVPVVKNSRVNGATSGLGDVRAVHSPNKVSVC